MNDTRKSANKTGHTDGRMDTRYFYIPPAKRAQEQLKTVKHEPHH